MPQQRFGVRQDIVELISSEKADYVTLPMVRIYNRPVIAPAEWWESSETLRMR